MIEVDLTLNVRGLGLTKKSLGRVTIANDSTGTETRGNYVAKIYGAKGKLLKTVRVENFARKSNSALKLLKLILDEAYP